MSTEGYRRDVFLQPPFRFVYSALIMDKTGPEVLPGVCALVRVFAVYKWWNGPGCD